MSEAPTRIRFFGGEILCVFLAVCFQKKEFGQSEFFPNFGIYFQLDKTHYYMFIFKTLTTLCLFINKKQMRTKPAPLLIFSLTRNMVRFFGLVIGNTKREYTVWHPSRHQVLTESCFNVAPAQQTVAQHIKQRGYSVSFLLDFNRMRADQHMF